MAMTPFHLTHGEQPRGVEVSMTHSALQKRAK